MGCSLARCARDRRTAGGVAGWALTPPVGGPGLPSVNWVEGDVAQLHQARLRAPLGQVGRDGGFPHDWPPRRASPTRPFSGVRSQATLRAVAPSLAPPALSSIDAYLATLPQGIDSYPEAGVKGSVVRAMFPDSERSRFPAADVVPAPAGEHILHPPAVSDWVPEAHHGALIGAI